MSKENQFQRIAERYQQKLSDLTVLKMHLIRDEQENINQLLDEIADLLSKDEDYEQKSPKIEDIFRGTSYRVKYNLNDMLESDD